MTKLFQKALEAVRSLGPEEQDAIAEMMLAMSKTVDPEPVDPAHIQAVLDGLAEARAGKFATPEQVAGAFKRFDV